MPPKREFTSGQKKIINRYYEHAETISAHKLGELVSEIALAAGDAKKLDKLWGRAALAVGKLEKIPAARREKVIETRDVAGLAKIVAEMSAGG